MHTVTPKCKKRRHLHRLHLHDHNNIFFSEESTGPYIPTKEPYFSAKTPFDSEKTENEGTCTVCTCLTTRMTFFQKSPTFLQKSPTSLEKSPVSAHNCPSSLKILKKILKTKVPAPDHINGFHKRSLYFIKTSLYAFIKRSLYKKIPI